MAERPLRTRALFAFVALLQFGVPSAAAWADAQLDVAGQNAPVHIESHTTAACARLHPPDCGLCHFLSAPISAATPRRLRFAVRMQRTVGFVVRPVPVSAPWRSRTRPRAPPALS